MNSQKPKLWLRPIFPRGHCAPKQWMSFLTNLHLQSIHYPMEENIKHNKHNIVIFYKTWKKRNEIQLTKNKMDLNKSKMKFNIKAKLEHEPNFPAWGRCSPQQRMNYMHNLLHLQLCPDPDSTVDMDCCGTLTVSMHCSVSFTLKVQIITYKQSSYDYFFLMPRLRQSTMIQCSLIITITLHVVGYLFVIRTVISIYIS